jgi:hypothetical protein
MAASEPTAQESGDPLQWADRDSIKHNILLHGTMGYMYPCVTTKKIDEQDQSWSGDAE